MLPIVGASILDQQVFTAIFGVCCTDHADIDMTASNGREEKRTERCKHHRMTVKDEMRDKKETGAVGFHIVLKIRAFLSEGNTKGEAEIVTTSNAVRVLSWPRPGPAHKMTTQKGK